MLNLVLVQGNMTSDPETKSNQSGKFVTFSVAHNYGKDDKKVTTFVNCVANEKLGETIMKYFTKGKPIIVEGSLAQGKSSLYVRANSFHFVGPLEVKKDEPKPETTGDDLPY
jgi:single-strand DNA-binding protein